MSISITEGTAAGVLALKLNFYEFIPEDELDAADPTVLLAHELEDGGRYYILLTTRNGLYRYDINDIIEVQGFHHRAPLVAFVRKGRDMCNITGEKLHVGQVAEAFFRAIDEVSFEATQAQLIPDVESSRYDMLLETDEREEARLEMFAEAFDRQLRAMNMEYAGKRHSDRLGLPRIWCMKAGWSGYRQRVDVEQHGKRDAQYKWPFLQLSWDQLARDHVALPPPGVDGSVPAPASAE